MGRGSSNLYGGGTHTVMLEKNRMQFFHEILGFLDESNAMALK